METKAELRKKFLTQRAQSAKQAINFPWEKIGEQLRLLLLKDASSSLGLYKAIGSECDLIPLIPWLPRLIITYALPCVVAEDAPMVFREWQPEDPLVKGLTGTEEPYASQPTVTPTHLFVPFIAVDREGYRLGYGKGYYDRTLPTLREKNECLTLGLGYESQLSSHSLPKESHDYPLDILFTESRMLVWRQEPDTPRAEQPFIYDLT